MGIRKVKNKIQETKMDKIVDYTQFIFGIVFSIYGLISGSNIVMLIGGLLLLFSRRRINISIPKKGE